MAHDNRGQNILILDMRNQTAIFDYFVIATGSSRRQLHAMSEEIDHALEDDLGDRRMGIEGYDASQWILLDYGSVVIHLFSDEMREYYDLENLWGDAKEVPFTPEGGPVVTDGSVGYLDPSQPEAESQEETNDVENEEE
ncbi:Ribosomal silencing factor RsfS [Planctomycetales bacterium 10988]|nr:Ribosomal silencing factor RsfS [Planctomycetales bacterium 10988]